MFPVKPNHLVKGLYFNLNEFSGLLNVPVSYPIRYWRRLDKASVVIAVSYAPLHAHWPC